MTHEEIERKADEAFAAYCAVYGKSQHEEANHLEVWHHAFRLGMDFEREQCAQACETVRVGIDAFARAEHHVASTIEACADAIRRREP